MITSDLDIFPWRSRRKSPNPFSSRRLLTTSIAAFFSLTKSTLFPLLIESIIIFAIVWLFPVPGGPLSIKLAPCLAAYTAFSWLESASMAVIIPE
ncbi:hypothetical protein SE19_03570 [Acidiplasma aeolicum]|uniref:Uncharacterized protein n=1 Tax=Acidiplasma aeolicum TaxID=507754 RepID=A0A0P9GZ58_9ARCH|nr:hypothetical protein TZ01_08885 [Acidiplasma sp. MBA-1]KPV46879.1 hypothetical protein SE19_03570 [Acidiplasma aeolicum]